MANPREKEIIAEKIKNGEVKVKAKAHVPKVEKPKVEKPKTEQAKPAVEHEKLEFSEAQIVATVKAIGHPATSREVSDALKIVDPEQGRAFVRQRMAVLVKDKKIVTSKPEDKSRATFLYSVA